MQVDGEWFKDLNGNGSLDVYEDWRADIADRVSDLLSQMTLDQKLGGLANCLPAARFADLSDAGRMAAQPGRSH